MLGWLVVVGWGGQHRLTKEDDSLVGDVGGSLCLPPVRGRGSDERERADTVLVRCSGHSLGLLVLELEAEQAR